MLNVMKRLVGIEFQDLHSTYAGCFLSIDYIESRETVPETIDSLFVLDLFQNKFELILAQNKILPKFFSIFCHLNAL